MAVSAKRSEVRVYKTAPLARGTAGVGVVKSGRVLNQANALAEMLVLLL